jgi:hypothetical protein
MDAERRSRLLSWITTIFCSLYVEWMSYALGSWVGAFRPLFRGLGGPIPPTTMFVTGLTKSVLIEAGTLLVTGLVAKELLLRSTAVRQFITFMVFMSVGWFSFFCLDAIYKPMIDIFNKLG